VGKRGSTACGDFPSHAKSPVFTGLFQWAILGSNRWLGVRLGLAPFCLLGFDDLNLAGICSEWNLEWNLGAAPSGKHFARHRVGRRYAISERDLRAVEDNLSLWSHYPPSGRGDDGSSAPNWSPRRPPPVATADLACRRSDHGHSFSSVSFGTRPHRCPTSSLENPFG
jgi:hypothetical protein